MNLPRPMVILINNLKIAKKINMPRINIGMKNTTAPKSIPASINLKIDFVILLFFLFVSNNKDDEGVE